MSKTFTNNIVFCINEKYSRYLYVEISSIIRHSKENIHFYVIYSSIDIQAQEKIIKLVKSYKHAEFNIDFVFVNIEKLLENHNVFQRLKPWFGSYDVYNRLFLNIILEKFNLTNIVSMDVDMIVLSDLSELFSVSRTINTIGGIGKLDPYFDNHLYLNAGLLIINLNYFNNISFIDSALNVLNNKQNKLLYPEQDIINLVVKEEDKVVIPKRFNEMNCSVNFEEENTVVLHYAGRNKPWHFRKPWNHAKVLWFKEKYIANKVLKNIIVDERKVNIYFKFLEIIFYPFFFVINSIRYLQSTIKKFVKKFRNN